MPQRVSRPPASRATFAGSKQPPLPGLELLSHQRPSEGEVLFRFAIVGVEANSCFIVRNRRLVFAESTKKVGQFLVCNRLFGVQ